MVGPYFEEIYRGHDCCKDYTNPKRNLTIRPYRSQIGPRDSLRLWAKGFHLDCEQNCLSWELISGGGSLQNEYGDENVYYSPAYNENCENNATIALMCGGYVAAWAYVAINIDTGTRVAYRVSTHAYTARRYTPLTGWIDVTKGSSQRPGENSKYERTYWWKHYLCDDTLWTKAVRFRYLFLWNYNPVKGEWQLTSTAGLGLGGPFTSEGEIPWGNLGRYFPRTVDVRSKRQKAAACCPRRLLPGV